MITTYLMLMQNRSEGRRIGRHQVLLVAAADESEGLPPTIRRCFSHEISMGSLTEEQRSRMLSQSLQSVSELLNVCVLLFLLLCIFYLEVFNFQMSVVWCLWLSICSTKECNMTN